ncbi:MAG: glycosyl hydrolase [Alistipes sp.]
MKRIAVILIIFTLLWSNSQASAPQRDQATNHLYTALKQMTASGYTMFGMANALTLGYHNNLNEDIANSDIRDVVGDNPAFVESDFMWYSNPQFKQVDMEAMRQAHRRGAVVGYCWHMAGRLSHTFYINKGDTSDRELAAKIVSNPDRNTNADLDWFLTQLDTTLIPVVRNLGFPLIFRPFHEMTGDWFWWGNQIGYETYRQLFRLTVDYLRQEGIRNLLYCWAPDGTADFGFYPGDAYVDILGYDAYEPGIREGLPPEKVTAELTKLVDYADRTEKIAAWTEVGLRTEAGAAQRAYPTLIPDFWTRYVWNVIKEHPQIARIAWVMTWYNADWHRDGSGHNFVPYAGMNLAGSDAARADFDRIYTDPRSLFETQMPPLYATADSALFIRPIAPMLRVGQTLNLLGGRICDWFLSTPRHWSSSDAEVATIDPSTGKVTARQSGTAIVAVESTDGRRASARLTVID